MDFSDLTFKPGSVFLVTGGAGFIGSNLWVAALNAWTIFQRGELKI